VPLNKTIYQNDWNVLKGTVNDTTQCGWKICRLFHIGIFDAAWRCVSHLSIGEQQQDGEGGGMDSCNISKSHRSTCGKIR